MVFDFPYANTLVLRMQVASNEGSLTTIPYHDSPSYATLATSQHNITRELRHEGVEHMYPSAAASLARKLMNEHGLGHMYFEFSRSKRRFGGCHFKVVDGSVVPDHISLSEPLVRLNSEAEVRNTILHEIAHALVGAAHHHDWIWKAKARAIGSDGIPCASSDSVVVPHALWEATCARCNKTYGFNRKPTRSRACPCTARLRARDGFDAHTLQFMNRKTGEVVGYRQRVTSQAATTRRPMPRRPMPR